ncbi:MAG: hypothetical protein J6Y10_00135 [Lachnospiraceae bacterium]|nr:hypothetical protein [Lachnospiraceae bacterium]
MIGPVGTAEKERLTTRLGRERYLRRRPAGFGEDTDVSERIAIAAEADRKLCTATGTMAGTDFRIAAMAVRRAEAALAAIGRQAAAMTLLLSVPEEMPEADIREYLRPAYEAAAFEDVTVVRERRGDVLAHVSASGEPARNAVTTETETAGDVAKADVSDATGQAATDADAVNTAEPTWYIVMAGTAGIEGTLLLYEANRGTMEARYPKHFLEDAEELPKQAATVETICAGLACGAAAAIPGGDGGVYGALWKLGEKLKCGMRVDLPAIPIVQITIEVCEVTDIDPYQIPTGGSVLFVTAEPERLMKALQGDDSEMLQKAETAVIGYLTKEAARIIENRGEERYLEPYRGGA